MANGRCHHLNPFQAALYPAHFQHQRPEPTSAMHTEESIPPEIPTTPPDRFNR